jgi:hypothetical protein
MRYEDTPAGRIYKKLGVPEHRTLAEIDADVELADREMAARLGRHLTEAEKDIARRAAAYHGPGLSTPTLGLQEIRDALGWGITLAPRPEGAGLSVRWHDSAGNLHVEGDPEVARKYEAEVERRPGAREWAAGQPARGVAGAT